MESFVGGLASISLSLSLQGKRLKNIDLMEFAVKPDDCVDRGSAIVFLNGEILGTHCNPREFIRTMKQLRRAGHLGHFVNVYTQQDCVYIASDGGRVCRPLIVCDSGVPRLTDHHIAKVNMAKKQATNLNSMSKFHLPCVTVEFWQGIVPYLKFIFLM